MGKKSINTKYVRQLKKGDMKAFEEIYDFYKNALYYFAITLVKNTADAEEVVQETFLKVLNNVQTLQSNNLFHAWIYKITYNTSMTMYQKNARFYQYEGEISAENIIDSKEGPADMLAKKEITKVVRNEIEKLPDIFIQVAMLKYFDNFTTKEIAGILEIPEGTVKTRLNKVRSILKPQLEKKGYAPARYFTFSLSPFIFDAFNLIVENHQMPREMSARIFENISAIAVGTLGVAGASVTATSAIPAIAKFALVISLTGGVGVYSAYRIVGEDSSDIQNIAYYNTMTNKSIEIEVTLSKHVEENKVKIFYDKKPIKFKIEEKMLSFEASANGKYHIEVGQTSEIIDIQNIDKQYPTLEEVNHHDNYLEIVAKDDISGIDYKKSYIELKGIHYPFPKDGKVTEKFEENIMLYLYDNAGNEATYEIVLE